jgi:hypothetical protein
MLIEAGYPIEDWLLEIERIQSRDFDAANQVMILTGDPNRGLEYIGMEPMDTVDPLEDMVEEDPGEE